MKDATFQRTRNRDPRIDPILGIGGPRIDGVLDFYNPGNTCPGNAISRNTTSWDFFGPETSMSQDILIWDTLSQERKCPRTKMFTGLQNIGSVLSKIGCPKLIQSCVYTNLGMIYPKTGLAPIHYCMGFFGGQKP